MENIAPVDERLFRMQSELSALERQHLQEQLATYVNFLLLNHFGALIRLLYRVDVDEEKLKRTVREHPESDAAELTAGLLLSRQEEKIRAKKDFGDTGEIPEEEKW